MAKRVMKNFSSFELEEKWLNEMAYDGWHLVSYDSEIIDDCTYKFEKDVNASSFNYRIDYRTFTNKEDFDDYVQLFEETGWTALSENYRYNKHIFVSTSKGAIFSDEATRIEREKNRAKTTKLYFVGSLAYTAIAIAIYKYFDLEMSSFGGLLMPGFLGIAYATIDTFKRRKNLRTQ